MFINDVAIDWSEISERSYLRQIEALCDIEKIHFRKQVTFFAGENGSGKSTLLEAMAVAEGFNPEGGTRNYRFSTYDSHSELCDAIHLSRTEKALWGYFLRAESFYNVATAEEEYQKGPNGRPKHYHRNSHGESFLEVMQDSFSGRGLFFLDEPEAALSPQRQLALLRVIDDCRRNGSQFFIATHSPILMALPDADILSFDGGTLHPCAFEDTGSFRIMSLIFGDRERLMRELLDE